VGHGAAVLGELQRAQLAHVLDAADGAGRVRQVWVLKDGVAQAVNVQVGISDGRKTEVSGEGLAEGMAVITDQRSAGAAP